MTDEQISAEFYPHRRLWFDAAELIDLAADQPQGNGYSCLVGALLLIHGSLEGCMNFLGEKVRPQVWSEERSFFSGSRYHGLLGKTEYLADQLGVSLQKGQRPFQTIRQLNDKRNLLVHSRIESVEIVLPYSSNGIFKLSSEYGRIASADFIPKARKDVEDLCDALQKAAYGETGHIDLKGRALTSFTGQSTGTLRRE